MRLMFITKDILYAGVNDHQVDLFEGQYTVPNGMAYTPYVKQKTFTNSGPTAWPIILT